MADGSLETSELMAFYKIEEEPVPKVSFFSRTFHPLVDVDDSIPIRNGISRESRGRMQAEHLEIMREYVVTGTSSRPLLNP